MKKADPFLRISVLWVVALIFTIAFVQPASAVKPGTGGISHTVKQTLPIRLGTSGGWSDGLTTPYCCGGTLGSLIQIDGVKYILSNYHVFASDTSSGSNGIVAKEGDPIIQPAKPDVRCIASEAQVVGSLGTIISPNSQGINVDAAIAQVIPGMVSEDGAILEIGTISSQTVEAYLGQGVKKSGRTTGLTRSTVSGLNGTLTVVYNNECLGGEAFTKIFTGQIIIKNKANRFLGGGDSGSLLVEDVDMNPRAVGLLFAGSSTVAVANPIDEVLDSFRATMVGEDGTQGTEVPASAEIDKAKKAQAKHAGRLERVPKGVGHGIGLGHNGQVVIKVYVEEDTPGVRSSVPDSVDGIPVEIEETGPIVPFSNCR